MENENKVKLELWDNGDYSVGIGSSELQIDFNIELKEFDEKERKIIREKATELFEAIFMDKIGKLHIRFNDECVECGNKLKGGICPNKNCLNNPPIEETEQLTIKGNGEKPSKEWIKKYAWNERG